MKRVKVVVALLAALTLTSVHSAPATAAPTDPFQFKFGFNTAAIPGYQGVGSIAVNDQAGRVLVLERGQVDQFDAVTGDPVNFSGLGTPIITVGGGQKVLVDNTGGATQGNIYVLETVGFCCGFGEGFWAYGPDGKPIGSGFVNVAAKLGGYIFSGSIRSDGNLQLMAWSFPGSVEKWTTVWTPTGTQVGTKAAFEDEHFGSARAYDSFGTTYAPGINSFKRYKQQPDGSYVVEGETGLPNAAGDVAVAIDPATRDFFGYFQDGTPQSGRLRGIHYTTPLAPETPYTLIEGLGNSGEQFTFDGTGQWLYIGEGSGILRAYHREPGVAPAQVGSVGVDEIRSSLAAVHAMLDSKNADTTFYFEYGLDTNYGQSTAPQVIPRRFQPQSVNGSIGGLLPDTTYHVRLIATNSAGTIKGPDRVFKTYPISTGGADDQCSNALARKQTSAQRLPDCRAYELVTADDTAGYEVESYLVPGQQPFPGFPAAKDRLLYATHAGAIPGPWNATNNGPDPYLASRTGSGWVTDYKGLPANLPEATGSFASELGEADSTLGTFAFAGPKLCSPCFGSGLKTGLPIRLPNGQLVQGMAGSLPGNDSARPEGSVAKYFSADGRHLIFASKYPFEPGANNDGASLTVYDRDLSAGTTQIVSTDPDGAALTGAGISQLDISADGSRVVVAKKVGADSQGNEYVHPYMHVGASPKSTDLAPGSTSGVLYAGMSADGSVAYFTSADKLLPSDQDSSADLYRAAVGPTGTLDLSLVTGNSPAACNPVANQNGAHWNTTGTTANCDAVAIGGRGGVVADDDDSVYFLSPELFSGEGTANQPNLYRAAAGGAPGLVATLEPDNPLVLNSVKFAAARRTGDFQVTAAGNFAAFTSALPLTGVSNFGFRSVFRYDAASGQLACSSCDTSGTSDGSLADDVALSPNGLSLLEDGTVFFTTRFALVLNDANRRADVYETTRAGKQELISSGTGSFDAGLLTASADGTDVFFFTHDTLAPEEDRNGSLMKIYDARVEGGFFKLPAAVPCKASDECHGPSTPSPPPADIKSSGRSTVGNVVKCPKGRVKHRNKCVKVKRKKNKHAKKKKKGGRHA